MANGGIVDLCVTSRVVEGTLGWMVNGEVVELGCFRTRVVEVTVLIVSLDPFVESVHLTLNSVI